MPDPTARLAPHLLALGLALTLGACGQEEPQSTEDLVAKAARGDAAAMKELEQRTIETLQEMEKEKEAPSGGIVPDDVAAAELAATFPYDLDKLRSLTDDGSAHATFLLGKLLAAEGNAESEALLVEAVKMGSLGATFLVGKSQLHGHKPFSQDVEAGIAHLEKAAGEGHGEAAFVLGVAHRYGQGVPSDEAAAIRWYERAMQCGFVAAQEEMSQLRD